MVGKRDIRLGYAIFFRFYLPDLQYLMDLIFFAWFFIIYQSVRLYLVMQ